MRQLKTLLRSLFKLKYTFSLNEDVSFSDLENMFSNFNADFSEIGSTRIIKVSYGRLAWGMSFLLGNIVLRILPLEKTGNFQITIERCGERKLFIFFSLVFFVGSLFSLTIGAPFFATLILPPLFILFAVVQTHLPLNSGYLKLIKILRSFGVLEIDRS